jgi:hypothetical protein
MTQVRTLLMSWAGEQPEALDALALLHAPLGASPFDLALLAQRDVAADRLELDQAAVRVVEAAVDELHPAQVTLAVEDPILDHDDRLARGHARQLALDPGDVVRVGHGLPGAAEQRGPAATEEAAVSVVDEAHRAVRREPADDIRVGVDHGAVGRRLALTQGGLGDIDAIDEDPGGAPRAAGQRAQRQIEARRSAAGDVQVELGAYGLASARAGDRVRHETPAAGRPPWAVPQLAPHQVAGRSGQRHGRSIDPHDHAIVGQHSDERRWRPARRPRPPRRTGRAPRSTCTSIGDRGRGCTEESGHWPSCSLRGDLVAWHVD